MRGVNKVILIGNLGKDPEERITGGGTAVCNFSMAVSDSYKDKQSGEWKERTEWVMVVTFGRRAETAAKYLKKGSKVYVEGKIRTESYEKDGQKRYITKVYADEIQFLDSRGQGGSREEEPQRGRSSAKEDEFDSDITF